MKRIAIGGTMWLAPGSRLRSRQNAAALRAIGLALLAGGLFAGFGAPPATSNGPVPAAPAAKTDVRAVASAPHLSGWGLLDPRPLAAERRFAAAAEPVATGSLPIPGVPAGEWREESFAGVGALDGRTLRAGGLRIRLAGLQVPKRDETCRTLDGRDEPCATRAATQLELLTRGRTVTCRYRLERPDEAVGTCRIGASDLGERLLRTGFLRRDRAA
ncbi:MAG TPA: hypothetical protein VM434_13355 [Beijerinckiaceae bacterium]|nr:hypothetical protein [Beijerinckiaceae bacterium]